MDGLTLREWVTLILTGYFERAQVDAPRLSMGDYTTIVRGALAEHGVDPLTPRVSEIVRAEGFEPMFARVPRRCGASCGSRIFIPPGLPPELTRLLLHHERAHGWVVRRGDAEATEADIWLLTGVFACPPWLHTRRTCPMPGWYMDLMGFTVN